MPERGMERWDMVYTSRENLRPGVFNTCITVNWLSCGNIVLNHIFQLAKVTSNTKLNTRNNAAASQHFLCFLHMVWFILFQVYVGFRNHFLRGQNSSKVILLEGPNLFNNIFEASEQNELHVFSCFPLCLRSLWPLGKSVEQKYPKNFTL